MRPNFIIHGEKFPLVKRVISIAGLEVHLAMVPYDAAQLERIVRVRGLREEAWPYWLEEWTATYALAEFLDREDPAGWPGPALDLGCGAGFMAAYLRNRFGIAAFSCDLNPDACRLASLNVRGQNPSQTMESAPSRVFCGDFSTFPMRATFGLVLAGEMLYAQENHQPILEFLARHLAPGGKAFFADPGRSAAYGFRQAAETEGFHVDIRETKTSGEGRKVDIYQLSRKIASE